MRLEDFDYDLPETLIAQHALPERSASRLMVVDRPGAGPSSGSVAVRTHVVFRDLPQFLDENDVIVVNRSRVIPARLFVHRATGGKVELLFIRKRNDNEFEAWVRSIARLVPGETLRCRDVEGGERFEFVFVRQIGDREGVLRLQPRGGDVSTLEEIFESLGHVPLPPYIRRPDEPGDRERYQTVFARDNGSVAAPTAGLHFDERLLSDLDRRGVVVAPLVLHVGPGTFSPLDDDVVEANRLQSELFEIPLSTVEAIRNARASGRRIVAVGTTVTRALESAWSHGVFDGKSPTGGFSGETDLFIYPGYQFKVVDRLITNFHLPRSSLLLLVSAFLGREQTLDSYRSAVRKGYRFYSYGDVMLIR
jgi:S-adenosylmethionine:tRNA ribosyltransferase-isomerase